MAIGEVGRVFGGIDKGGSWRVRFLLVRSQECASDEIAEQIFELGAQVGFCIAIFYDYRRVEREAPIFSLAAVNRARAGHDHCFFWNDQRLIFGGDVHFAAHDIINRSGVIQNHAGAEDGAAFHDGAFENAAVPSYQDFVFDDDGHRAYGFENAADLGGGGNVAAFSDLRAAAYQRVRIYHRLVAYVRADVDEHRRHAGDAFADEAAVANAGAAGDDAHAAGGGDVLDGVGGLVEKRLAQRINGHVRDGADAESEKDAFFHPAVDAPTRG